MLNVLLECGQNLYATGFPKKFGTLFVLHKILTNLKLFSRSESGENLYNTITKDH